MRQRTRAGLILALLAAGSYAQQPHPGGTGSTAFRPSQMVYISSATALQSALDAAVPGDIIELAAGVVYTGNFRFPAKPGASTSYITVRSSAIDELPANTRVGPLVASRMPKLVAPNTGPVLKFQPGSKNWRIQGLELTVGAGVYVFDLVLVGDMNATTAAVQPANIELDRMFIHGDQVVGGKRGIFFNSNSVKLTNSYIRDFGSNFQDSQAVCVCNGPGPYEITNNYLEAAGENIMFGGCPNGIANIAPSDVTFSRNYVFKPLSWRISQQWFVKNLFEIKIARRVMIDSNVFENNWSHAQSGFGIVFTVRADGHDTLGRPFGVIEDVTFTNNIVINSEQGFNLLAHDTENQLAGEMSRLVIRNNLFVKVPGRLFQIVQGPQGLLIENNTSPDTQVALITTENETTGLVMRDNVFALGQYGIVGNGLAGGMPTIVADFPGSIVTNNGFIGGPAAVYPPGNVFVPTVADAGFVNVSQSDYELSPSSPFRGIAQNGANPGVNMAALVAATNGVADRLGARMTSPTPGSTLNTATVTFNWIKYGGTFVTFLQIGTTPGGYDLANTVPSATAVAYTATNVPLNGNKIYVRLWSVLDGTQEYDDYTYITGVAIKAAMISPTPGTRLAGAVVTFTWTPGTYVTTTSLWIGTAAGRSDLGTFGGGATTATVRLPTSPGKSAVKQVTIYVRLWSLIAGALSYNDYTYLAGQK